MTNFLPMMLGHWGLLNVLEVSLDSFLSPSSQNNSWNVWFWLSLEQGQLSVLFLINYSVDVTLKITGLTGCQANGVNSESVFDSTEMYTPGFNVVSQNLVPILVLISEE